MIALKMTSLERRLIKATTSIASQRFINVTVYVLSQSVNCLQSPRTILAFAFLIRFVLSFANSIQPQSRKQQPPIHAAGGRVHLWMDGQVKKTSGPYGSKLKTVTEDLYGRTELGNNSRCVGYKRSGMCTCLDVDVLSTLPTDDMA